MISGYADDVNVNDICSLATEQKLRLRPWIVFVDVDECSSGKHNWSTKEVCTNTEGSYNCSCKESYTGDERNCSDELMDVNLLKKKFKIAAGMEWISS